MRSTTLMFVILAVSTISTGQAQYARSTRYVRRSEPSARSEQTNVARAQQAIWHAQSREKRTADPAVRSVNHLVPPARPRTLSRSRNGRPVYRYVSGQESLPQPDAELEPDPYPHASQDPVIHEGEYYDHGPPEYMGPSDGWIDEATPGEWVEESWVEGEPWVEGGEYFDDSCGCIDGGTCFDEGCVPGCEYCPGGCSSCQRGGRRLGMSNLLGNGNLGFELGVQGFTGPTNLGVSDSFGFNQSVNFGMGLSIVPHSGIGWQLGVRTLQTNLSGAQFSDDNRNQTFLSTGLFRRASRVGWQWGFVVDLLNDDWYAETTIRQVRAEIGWRDRRCGTWGYWFNFGGDEDATLRPDIPTARPAGTTLDVWEPLNLHAFFYQRQLGRIRGSSVRAFAGFSGESDGLIGVDTVLPLNRYWGVRSNFTYLIPEESSGAGGFESEAWNVGIALTWNFRGNCGPTQFSPLFNVADNGSFIIHRVSAR